jgi:hypothetical protein
LGNNPRETYEEKAQRYLDKVGDRYVLNESGTVYEPKPDQSEAQRKENTAGTHHGVPFQVHVSRDWIATILSALTLVLLGFTVYYAQRQWQEMNGTLCEMRQQTALLQQQVEAATAAIVTKQFRITWPTKQAYLSVILNNRGRVAGTKIHADLHLTRVSLPKETMLGPPLPNWQIDVPEIESSPDLPTERGIYLNISPDELKGTGIPKALKIKGTFTYFNGFRNESEQACYYAIGSVEFKNKLGDVKQSQGPSIITCDGLPAQIAWFLDTKNTIEKQ